MSITISFDPTDEGDLEYIRQIVNGEAEVEEAAPPAKAPAKKAAAKKATPAPAEEEGGEDLRQQAVDKATEMVGEGRAAEVKGALAQFEVKRVGELDDDKLQEFLDLLSEDSVV